MSRWTENMVKQRSDHSKSTAQTAADRLPAAKSLELTCSTPNIDVGVSVVTTAERLRTRVLENSLRPINPNPKDFAENCRKIYLDHNHDPHFQFLVLLLPEDPLHYKPTERRGSQSADQHKQFFGTAQPVKHTLDGNRAYYTLKIRVLGATAGDVIRQDLGSQVMAAAVQSRTPLHRELRGVLQGGCGGEQVQGLSDIAHVGTVLPVVDQLLHQEIQTVQPKLESIKGKRVLTLADVAHTHGLQQTTATELGRVLTHDSATLNPLNGRQDDLDVFEVDPRLTDHVVIIPLWDELIGKTMPQDSLQERADLKVTVEASLAVGFFSQFDERETEHVGQALLHKGRQPLNRIFGSAK